MLVNVLQKAFELWSIQILTGLKQSGRFIFEKQPFCVCVCVYIRRFEIELSKPINGTHTRIVQMFVIAASKGLLISSLKTATHTRNSKVWKRYNSYVNHIAYFGFEIIRCTVDDKFCCNAKIHCMKCIETDLVILNQIPKSNAMENGKCLKCRNDVKSANVHFEPGERKKTLFKKLSFNSHTCYSFSIVKQ